MRIFFKPNLLKAKHSIKPREPDARQNQPCARRHGQGQAGDLYNQNQDPIRAIIELSRVHFGRPASLVVEMGRRKSCLPPDGKQLANPSSHSPESATTRDKIITRCSLRPVKVLLPVVLLLACWFRASSSVMLATNCLASSTECQCSWKNGKFVADCSSQNLTKVPKVSNRSLLGL